jgi:hypothetical protein
MNYLEELMLANTNYTKDEIRDMEDWEIRMHLGFD